MNFFKNELLTFKVSIMRILLILFFMFIQSSAHSLKLERFKGEVKLNNVLLKKIVPIKVGDQLEAMNKKSFFIIRYKDGSRFILRYGKIKLKENSGIKREVNLINGLFHSFVNPKSKKPFTVKTNNATMGVRGTKFYIEEKPEESYLCVCDGEVEVKTNYSSIIVKPTQDIKVTPKTKKLKVLKASKDMWIMTVDGFKELGFNAPQEVYDKVK